MSPWMLKQFIEMLKDASNLLNKNRLQGLEVLSSFHFINQFFFVNCIGLYQHKSQSITLLSMLGGHNCSVFELEPKQ